MEKPPIYECKDCGLNFTHYDNHMVIIKDDLWFSIAEEKDILCDKCISVRLKREIKLSDLWLNCEGITSIINEWFINKLK